MRSTLSNPVEAGIDSFTKLMGTFNTLEDSKQRRELMAQEEADRRLKNEREGAEFEQKKKTWADIEDEKNGNRDINTLIAANSKLKEAKDQDAPLNPAVDLDEDTQNAYLRAHHDRMGNASSAEIADQLEWQRYVASQVQGKKGILKFEGDRGDKFEKIYKIPRKNIETDSHGNVFKNSKISGALVDGTSPDMPSAPMVTREITPGAYKHIGDKTPTFVAPEGDDSKMAEKGNIDLNARPVVKNKDGSISTVLSNSFEQDGKEVLIPFVSQDGKIMTRDEAVKAWNNSKTKEKPYGDNLGVFNNIADADDYARKLHSSKIWQADLDYYGKSTQEEPLKHGGGNDPNAPLVIHPALFWHSKAQAAKDIADVNEQLQAKWGGTKYRERKEAAIQQGEESKMTRSAAASLKAEISKNPNMTYDERRLFLFDKMPDSMAPKTKDNIISRLIPEKQVAEKNPTPASLALDEAKGDETARKARKLLNQDEINKNEAHEASKQRHKTGGSGEAAEMKTRGEVDKIEGLIVKNYRQGDKNVETIEDLDISDDSKAELQDKKDKAIKLIEKGKSAAAAWNEVDKKRTKDPEKPKPAKKLDRTIVEKIRGKNKEVKDDDPEVAKVTAGVVSAKEAVKKLVDAGFNEQHSIDYVKRNSKKAK